MPEIMQFVPILIVSFAASLALTPLSRQIAMRLGVVDKPNQRKIHLDHKPMMGGLAVYVALTAAVLLFSPPRHISALVAVLAGAAVLALLGLIDDRYDLAWRTKLPVMILVAVGIVATGVQVQFSGNALIDAPMTIIWIIVLTNATNYLDNMDGQSTGMSAIAAVFLLVIAFTQNLSLVSLLSAAVLGSALGFLVYNFNPSSTFIGDMGALPLGFILSVLAIKLEYDQAFSVRWFIPILVLVLPILDFSLVTISRPLEGRSPAESGKDHTAHRLMSIGFGQRAVLVIIYSFCILFGLLAILVSAAPLEIAVRLVVFGLLLMAVLAGLLVWIRQRYQNSTVPQSVNKSAPELEKVSRHQV